MSDPKAYTVGWICPLEKELLAATICLDKEHPKLEYRAEGDNTNMYTLGEINGHNVVLAGLPKGTTGRASASVVAAHLFRSFPNVRIVLMVGIGGGAPLLPDQDIRLGDIVVSSPDNGAPGVIQYDFGKYIQGDGFHQTMALGRPAQALLVGVTQLGTKCKRDRGRLERVIKEVLGKEDEELQDELSRPDESKDTLFNSNVVHQKGTSCAQFCALRESNKVWREPRTRRPNTPRVHYGTVASADTLMKNAVDRDQFALERGVLCFEMEAAGLMNDFPCLVVRGVSDYSDSHKNDDWQDYAALAAAVYAKELLVTIPLYQVEREQRIADLVPILGEINDKVDGITRNVQHLQHWQHDQEDQATLKWFSALNFATKQNEIINERQDGTVQKLLNCEEYQEWLLSRNKTLYCEGMPGAGKTFAAATVIENLQKELGSDETRALAYSYLNYRQQESPSSLLSSILQQFAKRRSSLPASVKELHERHDRNGTMPSLDELSNALMSVSEMFSRVYIIVDALDEYDPDMLRRFLGSLFHLQDKTGVNIFVTSRFNENIREYFKGSVKMEIRASDDDVMHYLDDRLSTMQILDNNIWLKEEIKEAIVERAEGMFLLARLHMTSLAGCTTVNEFRARLKKLPDGAQAYDKSYDDILKRIQNQPSGYGDLAIKILCWVTFAKRVLSLRELKHAAAMKVGSTSFDEDDIPLVMLDVCAGLVTTEEDPFLRNNENFTLVRLIHYTTQEYLQDPCRGVFLDAQAQMTEVCITYLSLKDFESGGCSTRDDYDERVKTYALYEYAAKCWGKHARQTESLCDAVMVFLRSSVEPTNAAFQALRVDGVDFEAQWQVTGLHLASWFGIEKAAEKLLLHDKSKVDARNVRGETPLLCSAKQGHTQTVQLLVKAGADANKADRIGWTPLHFAAQQGYKQIVQLLLDAGASLSEADEYGCTALHLSALEGHAQIVQLLLDADAGVDEANEYSCTALQLSARQGHAQTVQLLLKAGADINKAANSGRTPLLSATRSGDKQLVQLLLDAGADVNKANNLGLTPLLSATRSGDEQLVQLLLNTSADVDKADSLGWTPLLSATGHGDEQLVQLLLDAGADINKANINGKTLLNLATRSGDEQVVKLLLDAGADINKADSRGLTPLMLSAEEGYEQVVQLLLDAGADVDKADNFGWTPLDNAAMGEKWSRGWKSREPVVRQLLEKGADITASKTLRRPHSVAKMRNYEPIARLLLKAGVDINKFDVNDEISVVDMVEDEKMLPQVLLGVYDCFSDDYYS